MHLCIVGDGAAGWIAYHTFKNHPLVKKITIIGSPSIAKIGVGESTTLPFHRFISNYLNLRGEKKERFLINIDAAIKYGVNYEGWSKKKFLHNFWNRKLISKDVQNANITKDNMNVFPIEYSYILGEKPIQDHHNDYFTMGSLYKQIYNNQIYLDSDRYPHAFHFDAGKFIQTLHNLAKNDTKLCYIKDTVIDLEYKEEFARKIVLQSGDKIEADYFISCIGQTAFNQKIFKEEYISYNDILLTNKALFYPLEYKNKDKEFHPYTIAKTMSNGWRWITPTLSRIGTGYVFSENHISVEDAITEFQTDIGDFSIVPNLVDFYPRRVKSVFKRNTCTLGMASGFQEPLDAPGLNITFSNLFLLEELFSTIGTRIDDEYIKTINAISEKNFNFWTSFILHQYKTSHRNDTDFWKDHKNVKFEAYDQIINQIFDPEIYYDYKGKKYYTCYDKDTILDPMMFYNTTSGKDIQWTLKVKNIKPQMTIDEQVKPELFIGHKEYFDALLSKYNI